MMQFINTFTGIRTNSACELVQTLFSATTKKNGKKRSGQRDYRTRSCEMVEGFHAEALMFVTDL